MGKMSMDVLNDTISVMEKAAECCGGFNSNFEKLKYEFLKELREYRELAEQGKLLRLPCAVGDTVYTNTSMQGWFFRKEKRPYKAKVVFIGINGVDNYMNVDFENGHMLQFKFSDIGKIVFLTKSEAESALQKMNEGDDVNA